MTLFTGRGIEAFLSFVNCLAVLLESFLLFDFYGKMADFRKNTRQQICTLLLFVVQETAYVWLLPVSTIWKIILGILTSVIYERIFLKKSFRQSILISTISILLLYGIAYLSDWLFDSSMHNLYTSVYEVEEYVIPFYERVFRIVLFGFVLKGILLHLKKDTDTLRKRWFYLSVFLYLLFFMSTIIIMKIIATNDPDALFYTFSFGGLLVVTLLILIGPAWMGRASQKSIQLSMLELSNEQQRQAIMQVDWMQSSIRRANHDHRNHLLCLQEMLRENHIEEAKTYLTQLTESNPETVSEYIQVNCPPLRAILTVKAEQCRRNGIRLIIQTDDTAPTCEAMDLCILLSNLLDNAIEASAKIQEPAIEVILSVQKNYYTVIVRNKIMTSVLEHNAELKTTKSDTNLHGIGTLSIREIVNKYQGMMEYYEEDIWFTAHIWLQQK